MQKRSSACPSCECRAYVAAVNRLCKSVCQAAALELLGAAPDKVLLLDAPRAALLERARRRHAAEPGAHPAAAPGPPAVRRGDSQETVSARLEAWERHRECATRDPDPCAAFSYCPKRNVQLHCNLDEADVTQQCSASF